MSKFVCRRSSLSSTLHNTSRHQPTTTHGVGCSETLPEPPQAMNLLDRQHQAAPQHTAHTQHSRNPSTPWRLVATTAAGVSAVVGDPGVSESLRVGAGASSCTGVSDSESGAGLKGSQREGVEELAGQWWPAPRITHHGAGHRLAVDRITERQSRQREWVEFSVRDETTVFCCYTCHDNYLL